MVDPGVYSGTQKTPAADVMFMTSIKIAECIDGLKLKNTEGFDRIPQRVLIDGRGFLMGPLTKLFKMIYRDQVILEQWLISKIILKHDKDYHIVVSLITHLLTCSFQ